MGLQERIKKIQEFENSLEVKKADATKKRTKQIDSIKRNIHLNLIKNLSDEVFKKKISDAELKLKVTKEVQSLFIKDDTPCFLIFGNGKMSETYTRIFLMKCSENFLRLKCIIR